ncbi:MAG: GxxExxY protein [Minisyncoccia bacterium]
MELKRKDLILPELSYKIIGVLFDVFNYLGYEYREKYYQRAIAKAFKEIRVNFKEQVYSPIEYKGENIGGYFFDFLVENKIILEIKRGDNFSSNDISQILSYLKKSKLQLGILARFSSKGLKYRRIVNIN